MFSFFLSYLHFLHYKFSSDGLPGLFSLRLEAYYDSVFILFKNEEKLPLWLCPQVEIVTQELCFMRSLWGAACTQGTLSHMTEGIIFLECQCLP